MTGVTLCIAVVAALAALLTTPSRALAIYCATLVLYPQALTLQVGSADFSVSRICILAVLANATVRSGRHRSFQRTWTDVFVLASWALGFVALLPNWMAWCRLAAMVGWNVAMLTVGPLTAILQLLYLFIAISTNMPVIVTAKAPRAS